MRLYCVQFFVFMHYVLFHIDVEIVGLQLIIHYVFNSSHPV